MTPRRVLTVGLHVIDVLGRYVTEIPEGQGLALLDEIRITVAGTAAATAVDLARLGVEVATVGAVGEDALGHFMRDTMVAEGVDCSRLRVVNSIPTSATMLPIRPDGSRPALHVVGSNGSLNASDVPGSALDGIDLLHLGGTCLLPALDGLPSADLLRRARERGITTTMDLIPSGTTRDDDALLPSLPFVDYLFPSEEDAAVISGETNRDRVIDFFLSRGVGTLIITMGGNGVSISTHEQRDLRLPAYQVDVVDTTGCGDAFTAGFITGILDGRGMETTARLGLACGGLVATGLGSDAGIIDRAQVEAFAAGTPTYSL